MSHNNNQDFNATYPGASAYNSDYDNTYPVGSYVPSGQGPVPYTASNSNHPLVPPANPPMNSASMEGWNYQENGHAQLAQTQNHRQPAARPANPPMNGASVGGWNYSEDGNAQLAQTQNHRAADSRMVFGGAARNEALPQPQSQYQHPQQHNQGMNLQHSRLGYPSMGGGLQHSQLFATQSMGPSQETSDENFDDDSPVPVEILANKWVIPEPLNDYHGPVIDAEAFRFARDRDPFRKSKLADTPDMIKYIRKYVRLSYDAMKHTGAGMNGTMRGAGSQATKSINNGHYIDDLIWKFAWITVFDAIEAQNGREYGEIVYDVVKPSPKNGHQTRVGRNSIELEDYPDWESRFKILHYLLWHSKDSCKNIFDYVISSPLARIVSHPMKYAKDKIQQADCNNRRSNLKHKNVGEDGDNEAPQQKRKRARVAKTAVNAETAAARGPAPRGRTSRENQRVRPNMGSMTSVATEAFPSQTFNPNVGAGVGYVNGSSPNQSHGRPAGQSPFAPMLKPTPRAPIGRNITSRGFAVPRQDQRVHTSSGAVPDMGSMPNMGSEIPPRFDSNFGAGSSAYVNGSSPSQSSGQPRYQSADVTPTPAGFHPGGRRVQHAPPVAPQPPFGNGSSRGNFQLQAQAPPHQNGLRESAVGGPSHPSVRYHTPLAQLLPGMENLHRNEIQHGGVEVAHSSPARSQSYGLAAARVTYTTPAPEHSFSSGPGTQFVPPVSREPHRGNGTSGLQHQLLAEEVDLRGRAPVTPLSSSPSDAHLQLSLVPADGQGSNENQDASSELDVGDELWKELGRQMAEGGSLSENGDVSANNPETQGSHQDEPALDGNEPEGSLWGDDDQDWLYGDGTEPADAQQQLTLPTPGDVVAGQGTTLSDVDQRLRGNVDAECPGEENVHRQNPGNVLPPVLGVDDPWPVPEGEEEEYARIVARWGWKK